MNDIDMIQLVASEMGLKTIQVKNTIELLDAGSTVPFISRYRKEKTGSLDEEQIRLIEDRMHYLRALEARKETILTSIKEQGKLTEELASRIIKTSKLQELEDLYLPYKPKKRTRATVAREMGLEPLAQLILDQQQIIGTREQIAEEYINDKKNVFTVNDALQGARDIVAENISENAEIRKQIRDYTYANAVLSSEVKKVEERTEFELYYEYSEPIKKLPPHRILAINRGETKGILKVGINTDTSIIVDLIEKTIIINQEHIFKEDLKLAISDAYQRLISPSISRELRSELTRIADSHAIEVFAKNLKSLLLQPPLHNYKIMGIDPGYRTGCKVAVIDETGKYLKGITIYPHSPQNQYLEAKSEIRKLVSNSNVDLIAIGNGTASRETEQMVAELISEIADEKKLSYYIVNEAGASVYSASKIAKEEFPDLEASMRGNISIARRILDPLAELVKIDPKSIGVGLYQHDVNQKRLSKALENTVESCVNSVGININTASAPLLKHVSGLTSKTAGNIINHRDKYGPFRNRKDLRQVDGIGNIAFEQAAGFLRIPDGNDPLDNTSIHPESYDATRLLLKRLDLSNPNQDGRLIRKKIQSMISDLEQLLRELNIGKPTFEDILMNLEKPGRDPRDELPKPIFRTDVLKIEDLKTGMKLKATVRNVVDFGAFVDIGVKQDGLVHISQMSKSYIKKPLEIVSVGDTINVKVLSVDLERGRIGLSMLIDD